MTVTDEAAPVLVVRRQMAVPRERVFEAWLDSESLAHWMRPGDITHATVTVDPRVGGGFRIVMERPTHAHEHWGEYLAIEPPALLSFTWISSSTDHQPTVVTIEFHERGAGTELVLTHRGLPAKAVEGHRRGWTDIVRSLEEALTRG
jgi:glutathione S-transferase